MYNTGCAPETTTFEILAGAVRQDIAVLDQLAPRIERTQTLAPETRDAIMRLVDRARVSTGDARSDQHRSATIERVTSAIRERGDDPALGGSVGQAVSAR